MTFLRVLKAPRTVTESQYRCKMVSKPVTRYETVYESSYDYYTKSYKSTPRSKSVTRYEYKNECSYEPVTRTVTRYEYQYESKYIPPSWDYISRTYANHQLVEREPVCAPSDGGSRFEVRLPLGEESEV